MKNGNIWRWLTAFLGSAVIALLSIMFTVQAHPSKAEVLELVILKQEPILIELQEIKADVKELKTDVKELIKSKK